MSGRSHPPSLVRLIERTLKREIELLPQSKIAVAVSGGPDSMALIHALSKIRSRFSIELLAVSVDHGLRAEAKEEVALVGELCARHEIRFESVRVHLVDGGNLQERARDARYKALWDVTDQELGPHSFLATAHHKEDRAETVLLRVLRGTSLAGLSVLPARAGRLLRPMVRATRDDVEAHVKRHGIPVVRDPSNEDPRFLRVRVRNELLPLLRELSPGIVTNLAELADEGGRLPEPLGLNREQRAQFRSALRDRKNPVNLLLPGGLRLVRERPERSSD